jgi:hypothetical protein
MVLSARQFIAASRYLELSRGPLHALTAGIGAQLTPHASANIANMVSPKLREQLPGSKDPYR